MLHLRPLSPEDHLSLVEVEGSLHERTGTRWRALLLGLVSQKENGLVVDLRGCETIDDHCLKALLATGAALKAAGGAGVALVLFPGSALSEALGRRSSRYGIPSYASASDALLALGAPASSASA